MNELGNSSPWMNGEQANSQFNGQGMRQAATMAATIFTLVGTNRYAERNYYKPDDVVVEETARDNKAVIAAGGTIVLLVIIIIVLIYG